MADAILYSHLDPGAPALDMGMNNSSTNGVVGFYNFLVPCLVTGYGTGENAKSGQGWTVVHAALPEGFKLQAPDGVYYIFCQGESQTYAYGPSITVWMAEVLTDLEAYPPVGTNVRSGNHSDVSSSSDRHWISPRPYYGSSNYAPESWVVVARGGQVFISVTTVSAAMNSATGVSPEGSSDSYYGNNIWLGNTVFTDSNIPKSGPQNACILGGDFVSATYNPSSQSYASSSLYGAYTRLRSPFSGVVESGELNDFSGLVSRMSGKTRYKNEVALYPPDLTLERKRPAITA